MYFEYQIELSQVTNLRKRFVYEQKDLPVLWVEHRTQGAKSSDRLDVSLPKTST